ncbi:hypothetical protein BTO30_03930 [Domibacillus antri]|uniref:HTH tetR-type domain-containing protein n=1 Tax=Domibacillus antri TaxID=1714264 RepID=A0A1Q8Q8C4_9BACI|nr:TetR/AcrR family transcriptional regulator [Domibacillus antri]OLN23583.1 hypothetical protein BTO30_03930 [Domibacillus antri]
MSADTIKQAAAVLFADHGYAGTSLSQISGKAGMKKPSIYAHFKSKDDLFMSLLDDAFSSETARVKTMSSLQQLLEDYVKRQSSDALFRFLIKSSFFPPEHLKADMLNRYYSFLDTLEEKTGKLLEIDAALGIIRSIDIADTASMYTIIVDSIFVELCYGSRERTEKRLNVAWGFFWNSIKKGQDQVES